MENRNVIILYVPVVHAGYLKFIEDNANAGDIVYLIDGTNLADNFKELKKLLRDVRAIPVQLVLPTLKSAFPRLGIRAMTIGSRFDIVIRQVISDASSVIMHDDDVTATIIQQEYLKDLIQKVQLRQAFLRWDSKASLLQKEIDVPVVSHEEIPVRILDELKSKIGKSVDWWRQVACVVFDDLSNIVLASYNEHYPNNLTLNVLGDPRFNFKPGERIELCTAGHAERVVMGIASGKKEIGLEGCTMLVSDFPCPPCAYQLVHTGIKRLLFIKGYSSIDSQKILEDAGIEIRKVSFEQ